MVTIFDFLFGCWHRRMSFPVTSRRHSGAASETGTYVVCLACGKEFGYDWQEMRVLPSGAQKARSALAWKLRAAKGSEPS
jgi:hypothetical protein